MRWAIGQAFTEPISTAAWHRSVAQESPRHGLCSKERGDKGGMALSELKVNNNQLVNEQEGVRGPMSLVKKRTWGEGAGREGSGEGKRRKPGIRVTFGGLLQPEVAFDIKGK